ncbi:hypothetical protein G6F37_003777 [Rhizopus arrhizus]|nr:hypothetical protein G6F38_009813 [Rhizopus arrhizus]KAG1160666.1 hypothetical protein G6F37_003777 [Rhizopus arrhizus]
MSLRCSLLQQHHPGVRSILFRPFDNLYDSSAISVVLSVDINKPDIFPLALNLDLSVSAVIQKPDFFVEKNKTLEDILARDVFEYAPALDCLCLKVSPTDRPNITFGQYRVQKLLC